MVNGSRYIGSCFIDSAHSLVHRLCVLDTNIAIFSPFIAPRVLDDPEFHAIRSNTISYGCNSMSCCVVAGWVRDYSTLIVLESGLRCIKSNSSGLLSYGSFELISGVFRNREVAINYDVGLALIIIQAFGVVDVVAVVALQHKTDVVLHCPLEAGVEVTATASVAAGFRL